VSAVVVLVSTCEIPQALLGTGTDRARHGHVCCQNPTLQMCSTSKAGSVCAGDTRR
jgi:hypothetical protein